MQFRGRLIGWVCVFLLVAALHAVGCGKSKNTTETPKKTTPEAVLSETSQAPDKAVPAPSPSPTPGQWMTKVGELVKNEDIFPADETRCRDFCKKYCPPASKCRIGKLTQIQKCKSFCYDPCLKGLLTKKFVECTEDSKSCPELKECNVEYLKLLREKTQKGKSGN
jgi:hypothetical protein